MGLFSSSKSSSSTSVYNDNTSTTSNTATSTQINPYLTDNENPIVANNGSWVTVTDAGSIGKALDFAGNSLTKSLDFSDNSVSKVLELASKVVDNQAKDNQANLSFVQDINEKFADAQSGVADAVQNNKTIWILAAAFCVFVLARYRNG